MIVFVTGARPNFIKVKPMIDRCKDMDVDHLVYNSNQHDPNMQVFDMGTDTNRTISRNREGRFAWMMSDFSRFLNGKLVDVVVVVGDTDTSFACALVADMRGIPVAHVEAGMRSFYHMPEETNRVGIDRLSTYRYAPTKYNLELLEKEGLDGVLVGNIMVESLMRYWKTPVDRDEDFILIEMHRAENDPNIKDVILFASKAKLTVKWVKHPRHSSNGIYGKWRNIKYLEPMPYEKMLTWVMNAAVVITDSGGLQVDTSVLKTPCITFRKQTEWKITLERGTNILVDSVGRLEEVYMGWIKTAQGRECDFSDQLWDDKVSERIINHLTTQGVKG